MLTLNEVKDLADRVCASPDERSPFLQQLCPRDNPDLWYGYYYDVFYALTKALEAPRVVEIGTQNARSTAHLACGNANARVVTIDIDPTCAARVAALPCANVTFVEGDSMQVADAVERDHGPFDVAFIDGLHEHEKVYREYQRYRLMMHDGGLMFFDDISSREFVGVRLAWFGVRDPKAELPALHFSGFGVCAVDRSIEVPRWEELTPCSPLFR